MAHPVISIENAFISRLIGFPQINQTVGAFVFPILAPPGNSLPYIEVAYQHGGDTNTSPRDDFEVTMRVLSFSTDNDQSGQLLAYIREALHEQLIDIPGWSNYYTQEGSIIERVRYGDLVPVFVRGMYFEVRADRNSVP